MGPKEFNLAGPHQKKKIFFKISFFFIFYPAFKGGDLEGNKIFLFFFNPPWKA